MTIPSDSSSPAAMRKEHQQEAIARRVNEDDEPDHTPDAVLGSIDGCITTFAVVAGAVGGGFGGLVVVVLGVASLVADGFSMAASNYLATKSKSDAVDKARKVEQEHIDRMPEAEKKEVRAILANKGLPGDVLDEVVETITADRDRWVHIMLEDELHLDTQDQEPGRAARITFGAFLLAGLVPLLPFLIFQEALQTAFVVSCACTGVVFFGIGMLKGWTQRRRPWHSGMETFLIGGVAALLAFAVGFCVRMAYGTG